MEYILFMGICWVIIGVVWGMGALYNAVRSPAAKKKTPGTFTLTLLLLGVIFASEFWGPTHIWTAMVVRSDGLAWVGCIVLLVGTAFTIWARLKLGTMWSSAPVAKVDHALKTTGPYAVTRNPIYTGLLTMLAGTAMIKGLGVWVIYFIVGVGFVEIKIRMEERLLIETFGERYLRYREQVPQLVPGIHLLRKGQHIHG